MSCGCTRSGWSFSAVLGEGDRRGMKNKDVFHCADPDDARLQRNWTPMSRVLAVAAVRNTTFKWRNTTRPSTITLKESASSGEAPKFVR